ncbi:MAG: hypothetical protein EBS65_03740 [Betaproteobacteria bacterium]|nr:hypothetical protein [Betaproteobacteria bacterium]
MRSIARGFAGVAVLLVFAAAAVAQEAYPSRAVSIVVPFPPGGGADILARVLGQKLSETWRQPVLVENKPGAAGVVGANGVARSEPDGYTLLMAASGAIVPANAKDLAPVTLVAAPPYMLLVHSSVPKQVQAGALKALAVTGPQRSVLWPEIPTVAESGVPGYDAVGWYGLLAPAKTPREVVLRIAAEVARALQVPAVAERLSAVGATPAAGSPEDFARFLEADTAKWANLMAKAGITPQ